MFSPPIQRLPFSILQTFLFETVQLNPTLQRRMAILGILWNESGLTKPALQTRVEALLAPGCFGQRPTLAFARDIRFLRQVLQTAGYRLKYSRSQEKPGYRITGRPTVDPAIEKKINAAFAEVSPEQAAIFCQVDPGRAGLAGRDPL